MGGKTVHWLQGTKTIISVSPPGLPVVALPNLNHLRWLVPRDRRLKIKSIQHFLPRSAKSTIWCLLVGIGLLRGKLVWLSSDDLDECLGELADVLGNRDILIAMSCGREGAYQKHTLEIIDPSGAVLAFVKLPASDLAIGAIDSEHTNLKRLAGIGVLAGRVPEVLGTCTFAGRPGLILSPGPSGTGPLRLGPQHLEFLRRLHVATTEELTFSESGMWSRIRRTVAGVSSRLSEKWTRRYSAALPVLNDRLGTTRMPCGMAHRDFAPWNTRIGSRGLYVFDWEAALGCSTPIYDAFHFEAIQAALRGGSYEPGTFINALLDSCWPDGRPFMPYLYLAYLVDISLFYAKARVDAPLVGDNQVLNWFGAELDKCLGVYV